MQGEKTVGKRGSCGLSEEIQVILTCQKCLKIAESLKCKILQTVR